MSPRVGFIAGTVRTGTTLLSRLIAEHSQCISFREMHVSRIVNVSELNRHVRNALAAGLTHKEIKTLGCHLRLFEPSSIETWLKAAALAVQDRYDRPLLDVVIEKDPELFLEAANLPWLLNHPTIYTVRNPRGILDAQDLSVGREWRERALSEAISAFINIGPHLSNPSLLIVRYEDLVTHARETMERVFEHLGVNTSDVNKLNQFSSLQYLVAQKKSMEDVDSTRATAWIGNEELESIYSDASERIGRDNIRAYEDAFGY
tara:strand:- start:101236 stop:102018 length:783 start_codon:yes stop_codon:yes gene_type:complete